MLTAALAAALLAGGQAGAADEQKANEQKQTPPTNNAAKAPVAAPVAAPVVAVSPSCDSSAPCMITNNCCAPQEESGGGVSAWAEFLYLKARNQDIAYAQPRDGFSTLSRPTGAQGFVEPDYAPGVRFGAGVGVGEGWVESSFSWWESQSHSFEIAPPGSFLQSNLTLPNLMNSATDSVTAAASYGLEFRMADIDYKHLICGECNCGHSYLAWFAGARYAFLRQTLEGTFQILGTTLVDTHINFDGAGPHLGLEGEVAGPSGLRLYGRTSIDVLAGHFGASYNQFNVFVGNQGNIDYKADRLVPIWELELGVGWASSGGQVRAMIGYDLTVWFNTVTTGDFINALRFNQPGSLTTAGNFTTNMNNLTNTLAFDGLTARVEFKY
jgi:hypothetical protein